MNVGELRKFLDHQEELFYFRESSFKDSLLTFNDTPVYVLFNSKRWHSIAQLNDGMNVTITPATNGSENECCPNWAQPRGENK